MAAQATRSFANMQHATLVPANSPLSAQTSLTAQARGNQPVPPHVLAVDVIGDHGED
jgi:hypothetical protein